MGKGNIIGGSPLRLVFELDNGDKSPEDFEVKLVRHGNAKVYVVERTDGTPFETKRHDEANMSIENQTRQKVVVGYDEL